VNLVNRRPGLPALVILSTLALAACSGSGTDAAPAASGSAAASATATASASATTAASPLASVNPCEVLTAATVSKYHVQKLQSGGLKQTAMAPTSKTVVPHCALEFHDGKLFVLDVQLELHAGLSAVTSNSARSVAAYPAVDGHQARLTKVQTTTAAFCYISVGVTSSSRTDLGFGSPGATFGTSCAEAKKMAPLIIPQLPATG
jgi:Protein of unknown function (DUF3558)